MGLDREQAGAEKARVRPILRSEYTDKLAGVGLVRIQGSEYGIVVNFRGEVDTDAVRELFQVPQESVEINFPGTIEAL